LDWTWSSAALWPEAALSLLIRLAFWGSLYRSHQRGHHHVIGDCVLSYRQTIALIPPARSYTVARFNLGAPAGLLGGALLADYISRLQWAFPRSGA